jgi:hypothetical protein
MNLGRVSSLALFASGIGGIARAEKMLKVLGLDATSSRGVTETRVGLGGTYAALGAYGLLSRSPVAQRAVGVTWLGAGLTRLATRNLDRPDADWTYWTFLAGELGLGVGALVAARPRRG